MTDVREKVITDNLRTLERALNAMSVQHDHGDDDQNEYAGGYPHEDSFTPRALTYWMHVNADSARDAYRRYHHGNAMRRYERVASIERTYPAEGELGRMNVDGYQVRGETVVVNARFHGMIQENHPAYQGRCLAWLHDADAPRDGFVLRGLPCTDRYEAMHCIEYRMRPEWSGK